MSFQNFKTNSYRFGGRHRPATTNFYGDNTSKCSKVSIGFCSICNRRKSLVVSDNKVGAEVWGDFFNNLSDSSVEVGEKLAKNVIKKPGRALEKGANVSSAFASRSPIAGVSSLPEVIKFHHTGKRLYFKKMIALLPS